MSCLVGITKEYDSANHTPGVSLDNGEWYVDWGHYFRNASVTDIKEETIE